MALLQYFWRFAQICKKVEAFECKIVFIVVSEQFCSQCCKSVQILINTGTMPRHIIDNESVSWRLSCNYVMTLLFFKKVIKVSLLAMPCPQLCQFEKADDDTVCQHSIYIATTSHFSSRFSWSKLSVVNSRIATDPDICNFCENWLREEMDISVIFIIKINLP